MVSALIFAPAAARSDFLDALSGKSLECEPSDGSYPVAEGYSQFFISKKGKILWSTTELAASEGSEAILKKPSLRKRTNNMFVVSIQSVMYTDPKPTTLTFERSGKNVKLTRGDRDEQGERRPTEICKVKGGVENVIRQQNDQVMGWACNHSDINVACMKELVRLCGENPTEKCRKKNQKILDAIP